MSTPASLNACAAFYAAQHGRAGEPPLAAGTHAPRMATAADLCSRDVVTCGPHTPVAEAARLMRSRHVGAVVVVESRPDLPQLVTGIVTHRDITTALAAGEKAHQLPVADIMTREVLNARAGDPGHGLLAVMHREHIRRMPVTGQDDELLGMVTLDDLVVALAAQVQALTDTIAAMRHQQH